MRLPLQGGKGYAAEWDPAAAPVRMPLYLHDQRVVANPMGDRTRMTGGLLLDGLDESFDHRRVRAIASAAEEVLGVRARPRLTWRGLRPVHARRAAGDRRRRTPRVVFATGHGMLGVTLAPLTGRLVASVVAGAATHPALGAVVPRAVLSAGELRLGGEAREPPARRLRRAELAAVPRPRGRATRALELDGGGVGAARSPPYQPPF